MTAHPTAVADGLTVRTYDDHDVFDCVACHDTGIDRDCDGHKVLGRWIFCPCPHCGEGGDHRVGERETTMLYTILGERMTAGRAWDAFVNQGADDFMHHQEQTEDALSDFVARYATDVPSLFGWDTDAIRWTSDDTDAIAVAMLAYLEGLGYL